VKAIAAEVQLFDSEGLPAWDTQYCVMRSVRPGSLQNVTELRWQSGSLVVLAQIEVVMPGLGTKRGDLADAPQVVEPGSYFTILPGKLTWDLA